MELKLVYRFLRQVSDWVVDNYYSEVVVEGEENVPIHGPIIIASTHHNEMIDIAALAAKLPHRRHLAFWAKASMFKNPLGRAVMTSSGAIPVRRNPNNAASADAKVKDGACIALSTEEELAARASLFRETTLVLKNDGVVGIFPEGTSCTGWRVFQTMPGAAWAALEYTRAIQGEEGAQGVKIVPVAITYTDKSKYLSRIHIRYGEPIRLDDYVDELMAKGTDPNVASKSVASKVTAEIEARLVQITVNAPDWEAICATKTATQILWTDEDRIPLGKWVDFNQRFVASLDGSLSGGDLSVKDRLCKYNALLHYSGIEHRDLASLLPSPTSTSVLAPATVSMLTRLPLAVFQFTLFFPSLLFVLPGYFTGPLAKKVGANIALLFGALWRFQDAGHYAGAWASHKLGRIARTLGLTYLGATLLMRWHNLLVKGNYKNLKLLRTYWKILRFSTSRSVALDASQLESYMKPPHPVVNPFIKSKYLSDLPSHPPHPPATSSKKLLAYLFDARRDAEAALGRHLDESTGNGGLRRVKEKAGEKGSVPPVGVDARTPQDVQEAVRFAKRYNLRVVVHNTGHDFLGRSTGRGGFLIWTHWMKDIAFQENFVAETDRVGKGVQAITLGAGVQWVEAYKAVHAKGRIVVGGVSIGGTVGAAGGWILGGGHSALSPAYGFGVDNVLEFKLVTADAKYLTVNAHNNPSLFWALKGGGGGTFGIVTSVTYRTHPNVPLIASFATTNFSTPEIAQKVATEFIRVHPALSDYHWGGYSLFSNHSFQMFQIVPNVSQVEAQKTVQPFFDFLTDTAGNATLSGLMEFPTFLDWINFIFGLTPGSQVGFGQEVSSRLLAKDTALRKPEETAKLLLSLPRGVSLNSVAGGASSLIDPSSSAFHPSWRRAIAEITISESWGDSDSTVENIHAAQLRLQATTRVLDTVTTDSAAYYNEATLHEDDFRKSFWGPHYRRLKEIKHQVDPDSLFVVPRGVGSEDWDDQLNCRK
ncbi:hypothetical protein D9611_009144 [Ephemerocybe angulata]|uniref:FAD-binding PCMH-type domain-containing protein n=1 Tax=Ephemerocybe angulata TaxID=980116 RepID=A0A8H5CDM1_9AGAR|nr:hypothetical protein D9611_009144 [Tulosesus angulatus]